MESRENPTFGRKVFFLNPSYNVKQLVIKALQEDEYETYIIDDYKDTKNILRHFPDSICLINIDGQMTIDQWFNFVVSIEQDESLKSIFLGILSSNARKSEREHFMLHTQIPAGFIPTNGGVEDLTETLRGILELNGAKGRRQYVRAKCNHDPTALITFSIGTTVLSLHVIDISTVGLACSISPQLAPLFQVNSVIRDVAVILGKKKIQCSCAVFAVKQIQTSCSLVLLFMKGTAFSVKATVREYIARNLQYEMELAIENEKKDQTDYKIPPKLTKDTDEAFLVDADDADEVISSSESDSSVTDAPVSGLTTTKLY